MANPRLRWAYLPYSMHMAGPREAIQHMIIRKNYGVRPPMAPEGLTRAAPCVLHLGKCCGFTLNVSQQQLQKRGASSHCSALCWMRQVFKRC